MALARIAVFMEISMAGSGGNVKRAAARGQAVKKTFQMVKYFFGIPQMGDAGIAKRGYLWVKLGNRHTVSGCSLRPTRHPGQTPLIPISDHGNGRLNFSGAEFPEKYLRHTPNG
jgi:hypothetical protein